LIFLYCDCNDDGVDGDDGNNDGDDGDDGYGDNDDGDDGDCYNDGDGDGDDCDGDVGAKIAPVAEVKGRVGLGLRVNCKL